MPNSPVHAALPTANEGSVGAGCKPGLSGPANPSSPVSKRAQNASMESPVIILPGVSAAEMTKKER